MSKEPKSFNALSISNIISTEDEEARVEKSGTSRSNSGSDTTTTNNQNNNENEEIPRDDDPERSKQPKSSPKKKSSTSKSIATTPKSAAKSTNQSQMFSRFRMKTPMKRKPTPKNDSPSSSVVLGKVTSCVRCRRLKKKCDKTMPECLNCEKAGEPCRYIPRKQRKREYDEIEMDSNISSDNDVLNEVVKVNDNIQKDVSSRQVQKQPTQLENTETNNLPLPWMFPSQQIQSHIKELVISTVKMNISTYGNKTVPIMPKEFLLHCVSTYFRKFHHMYPVLSKSSILQKCYTAITENGIDTSKLNQEDQFDIYMILALGCKSIERGSNIPMEQQVSGYLLTRALDYSSDLSKNNIITLRHLILTTMYSLFNGTEWSTWELTGRMIRLALYLGLNTRNSKQKLSGDQRESRYRLFWCVYIMDRTVSVTLGKPLGIDDDDVSAPLPAEGGSEDENIPLTNIFIRMRKIEGEIMKRVHFGAHKISNQKPDNEYREEVFKKLGEDIDGWYHRANTFKHAAVYVNGYPYQWYDTCYHFLMMLVYKPSSLNPYPTNEHWSTVSEACLHTLKGTYGLLQADQIMYHWTTLYRLLSICYTMLYCMSKLRIKPSTSLVEIGYCIELLERFGSHWVVAYKSAETFTKLYQVITEIDESSEASRDDLIEKLAEFNSSYHQILLDCSVDFSVYHEYYL
ncbi:Rac GTPase-activating protein BCR/ABR [Scheffersomyces xylosifermentans]|uniref:Rac GTPase-activating protein BCR/ABR n=1 Tax=Scheffersomyces xylosifermentans TaxID=1304137 RepID=UPI00315CDFA9